MIVFYNKNKKKTTGHNNFSIKKKNLPLYFALLFFFKDKKLYHIYRINQLNHISIPFI